MVAAAFDLPQDNSKALLLKRIERFLIDCHSKGKRVLLIVDEAQNLPARSLEELRMLSNFMSGGKPLLQTFLLGQPEFRRTLQGPDMEQLRQRVIATCHLGPMNEAETESYILHRLKIAGWRDDPSFSDDAFAAIYRYAGGIPRRINVLCDRLLLLGHLDEKHALTRTDVAEVINDLQQEFAPPDLRTSREGGG
jgi:type II secretory pathway predicted ATPase ExeA